MYFQDYDCLSGVARVLGRESESPRFAGECEGGGALQTLLREWGWAA